MINSTTPWIGLVNKTWSPKVVLVALRRTNLEVNSTVQVDSMRKVLPNIADFTYSNWPVDAQPAILAVVKSQLIKKRNVRKIKAEN